ncbi:hypothetical protein V6N13_140897 [Hibiscus sabdariffa]|uniref:Tafazzin family protein n=1 Tax=Hibiscus sabdariffa TaxID=183260 RepID=A0ABR2Q1J0_9ROSI
MVEGNWIYHCSGKMTRNMPPGLVLLVGGKTFPSLKESKGPYVPDTVPVADHWHQDSLLKLVIQEIDQVRHEELEDILGGRVPEWGSTLDASAHMVSLDRELEFMV